MTPSSARFPICTRSLIVVVAGALLVSPVAFASTEKTPEKAAKAKHHHVTRHSRYGFLPGYVPPPDQNRPPKHRERYSDDGPDWYGSPWYGGHYYYPGRYWNGAYRFGYGLPRFYRGQWNGGSFGPCWTSTPIGLIWNCGR